MNCKPGDLAVIVKCDFADNVGKLVRVLRSTTGLSNYDYPVPTGSSASGSWEVVSQAPIKGWTDDWKVEVVQPGWRFSADDCDLRPIRDTDGQDETLTWAGKPSEVTA